jgi:polar amino acid transport system substrate-binding protein
MSRSVRLRLIATSALVLAAAVACASTSDSATRRTLAALRVTAPSTTTTTSPAANLDCGGDVTASLRPSGPLPAPGHMPNGTTMQLIQQRGRLIVGVDQDTLFFSSIDPSTGTLQGFDIDMLHRLSQAIFGDPNRIEFRAVTTAGRIPAVQSNGVDVVADAVTITCLQRQKVEFSSVYFDAGQRLMVRSDSPTRSLTDLAGKRICATFGSTAVNTIRQAHAQPYLVEVRTDCLAALQQGRVDAVISDDTILDGFHAQDPYTTIVGAKLTDEPYGMAINSAHTDLVRFVNGVLEQMRVDGSWQAAYRRWLLPVTGVQVQQPIPTYRG